MTIMPWSEYWQKVQTATAPITLPDLMVASVAYIEQYAKAGVVVDLKRLHRPRSGPQRVLRFLP